MNVLPNPRFEGAPNSVAVRFPSRSARRRPLNRTVMRLAYDRSE